MLLERLMSSMTNEFCLQQFEEYIQDPSSFSQEIRAIIDNQARPLKNALFGLNAHLGVEAVLGATVILELLIRAEKRFFRSDN